MPSVLITGTDRGLGLEFSRQYAQAGWRVFACCRRPEQADALHRLAREHPQLSVHRLDVGDHAQIDALADELRDAAIDVLLNNAGVYGDEAQQGFGNLDYARWAQVFRINTMAAVKMAEAFVAQVARSDRRVIAALSSKMGSIADNTSGDSYLYRSSKAALNAAMKSLAIDLAPRRIAVLILHPGWAQTRMGGEQAPLPAADSVAGMRGIIDRFTLADSGRFLNYDGREIPW
ncbi:SDR family oxidoreductase [Thermithiobacillus tepidarius DSM 3134]|uniref:SDR family oxidoreductase n=1 Tax=Thermithiobacillus tepidarius TaxID=929 RepID=UPI00040A1258|nr:SDR family oxidoreductase [Thermithiobacillus tepidarius]